MGRSSRLLEAWPLAVGKCIYSHTRALPGGFAVGGVERHVLNAVVGKAIPLWMHCQRHNHDADYAMPGMRHAYIALPTNSYMGCYFTFL